MSPALFLKKDKKKKQKGMQSNRLTHCFLPFSRVLSHHLDWQKTRNKAKSYIATCTFLFPCFLIIVSTFLFVTCPLDKQSFFSSYPFTPPIISHNEIYSPTLISTNKLPPPTILHFLPPQWSVGWKEVNFTTFISSHFLSCSLLLHHN